MADSTPNPLVTLADELRTTHSRATEVLSKIPLLVSQADGDVTFNLATPVVVPTFAKIRSQALGGDVSNRLRSVEALSRGLVQEVDRLGAQMGSAASKSPFWSSLDLSTGPAAGLTNDPFYRAEVDNSIRLPFDGYTVRAIDRKFDSSSSKIGNWILPPYTDVVDNRYSSAPAASQYVNANAYTIAGPDRVETRTIYTPVYAYYYGYYYYWYNYWYSPYYGYYYYGYPYYYYGYTYIAYYQQTTYSYTVQTTINLAGSMIGQTFQSTTPKVLRAVKALLPGIADYNPTAQTKMYITECSYGQPDMQKVITTATLVADTEAAKTGSTNIANCTFAMARPVVLVPGKSYSWVLETKGELRVLYTNNGTTDGGLFYTQDRQSWLQDIAKDAAYSLITCDFGSGVNTVYIDIPNLELSGGIASASQKIAKEGQDSNTVEVQINLNGTWYPIDYLNSINSLPPFTPARVKMVGTQYCFPIIDSVNSTITAFRPATNGRYISVDQRAKQTLTLSYELLGFNDQLHTFDPGLMVGTTRYQPTTTSAATSSDGSVRTVTCTFALPTSSVFRHDIRYSTLNASQVFDIRSVIDLNT